MSFFIIKSRPDDITYQSIFGNFKIIEVSFLGLMSQAPPARHDAAGRAATKATAYGGSEAGAILGGTYAKYPNDI